MLCAFAARLTKTKTSVQRSAAKAAAAGKKGAAAEDGDDAADIDVE